MSQRAVIASKLANMRQGERTDLVPIGTRLSLEQAAELLNVGRKTVVRVKAVERAAPEVAAVWLT
jgi:hypothetical protein